MSCGLTRVTELTHRSVAMTSWPGLVGCDWQRAKCIIRSTVPYRVDVYPYHPLRTRGTRKQMERAQDALAFVHEDARVILFVDKKGDVAVTPHVWGPIAAQGAE